MSYRKMNKQPFLFVGLDYENPYQAAEFAERLAEVNRDDFGFKLNLDFYINKKISRLRNQICLRCMP